MFYTSDDSNFRCLSLLHRMASNKLRANMIKGGCMRRSPYKMSSTIEIFPEIEVKIMILWILAFSIGSEAKQCYVCKASAIARPKVREKAP